MLMLFPLVLLQVKAVGGSAISRKDREYKVLVSISSPSGEGGGSHFQQYSGVSFTPQVSISSPSGEGGGPIIL